MEAKKSLGQNFLNSPKALADIISAGKLSKKDVVLEVGPGKGALTELLLQHAGKVIAIEKDDRLIPVLQEKFKHEVSSGNFVLIHGDVLEFDPAQNNLKAQKYKLIANIPYYITGTFLRQFLGGKNQPSDMVLMVQKEVAKRIVAQDEKESILSMSVKVYGEAKIISIVKAGSFVPAPNVDSAILSIEHISKDFFKTIPEETFFEIMKAGFAGKRKMLRGNLKKIFPEEKITEAFTNAKIGEKVRAEDITLSDWKKLCENFI